MKIQGRYLLVSALIVAGLACVFYINELRDSHKREAAYGMQVTSLGESKDTQLNYLESGKAPAKGQGAYVVGKTTQPPAGNALEAVTALRPLADSGDKQSALLLYLKLASCQSALASAPSDAEIEVYRKVGAADELLIKTALTLDDCEGVDDALLHERGKWLEKAASLGLVEAQLLYAIDSSAVLGDSSDMLRDPAKVMQYKSNAMKYLTDAASKGNVDALLRLGNAYSNGILVQRDVTRAYAYYRAAQLSMPNAVPSSLVSTYQSDVPRSQISIANQMAQSIAKACCGR